jgi:glutaredoxin
MGPIRFLEMGFRVYTIPDCPYCDKAKELLLEKGAFWVEFDINEPDNKAYIKGLGLTKAPQIWHGDRHIGGFDSLQTYFTGEATNV